MDRNVDLNNEGSSSFDADYPEYVAYAESSLDKDDEAERNPSAALPPMDYLVYGLFVCIGVGLLAPWFMVTSSADYLNFRFPGREPEFWLALCSSVALMTAQVFNMTFFKYIDRLPFEARAVLPLILTSVWMLLTPALPFFIESETVQFYLSLGFIFIIAAETTITEGSLYGITGMLQNRGIYTHAIQQGAVFAGVLSVGLRAITKVAFADDERGFNQSGMLYFGTGAGLNVLCALFCMTVCRTKLVQDRIRLYRIGQKRDDDLQVQTLSTDTIEARKSLVDFSTSHSVERWLSSSDEEANRLEEEPLLPQDLSDPVGNDTAVRTKLEIFWVLRFQVLSVMALIVVSASLFPGVTSVLHGQQSGWFSVAVMSCYPLGEVVGKLLPGFVRLYPPRWIWLHALVHGLLFIPLFTLALESAHVLPVVFGSDAYAFVIVLLLGFSNGYGLCYGMMSGPLLVRPGEQAVAGSLVFTGLVSGIFIGDLSSLIYLYA